MNEIKNLINQKEEDIKDIIIKIENETNIEKKQNLLQQKEKLLEEKNKLLNILIELSDYRNINKKSKILKIQIIMKKIINP